MAVVTIIGAGMMGSALAFPARENGHTVRLVGTALDRDIIRACRADNRHPKFDREFPAGISFHQVEEMEDAIDGADMIIGGISSFGVEWFSEEVLPLIPETTPVLTVTKGLFHDGRGHLINYPAYWKARLREKGLMRTLCAVGGPCTSYELVAHDDSVVTFCGEEPDALRFLKSVMQTSYYHIQLSEDLPGVEASVALKNGYALAVALTIGLNQRRFGEDSPLHYNSQAAVFGQSVREMSYLMSLLGVSSLDSLCVGTGDLYVTVYGGRTRLVGILLGRGFTISEAKEKLQGVTLESLVVTERVYDAVSILAAEGKADLNRLPLLVRIGRLLRGECDARIPWDLFRTDD
ncbi:MAG: glycerol-3-phosphate dehydrogenase [Clostridia bacterium]|nr:glycerol-3-phosphate dehydrogenase [Clostridia bacterium]